MGKEKTESNSSSDGKKDPSVVREIIDNLCKPLPEVPLVPDDIRVALADRILRDDECCLEGIEHILTHTELKITITPDEVPSNGGSSSSDAPPPQPKPVEMLQGMYLLNLINRAGMTPEKINYVKVLFLATIINSPIDAKTRVCKHAFQLYPSYHDVSTEKLAASIKNMVLSGHLNNKPQNIQPIPESIDVEKLPEAKSEDENLVPASSYSIDYAYDSEGFKNTAEYKRWIKENFSAARMQCERMGDHKTIKDQLFKLVVSGFSAVCKSPTQFFFVNCCKSPHSPKGIEFLDLWELVANKHPDKGYRMFFGQADLMQPDVKKQWLVPKKKKFNRWTSPVLYKKTVDSLAKPQLPFYIPGYIQTDWCTNHILTEPNSGTVYVTQSDAGTLDTIVLSFSDEEWMDAKEGVQQRIWADYCQFTKWLRTNQDEEVERHKSKITEAQQEKLAHDVATSSDSLEAYSKMMEEIANGSSSSSPASIEKTSD